MEVIGEYSEEQRIAVVIPYRKGSREQALRAGKIHHGRAGVPCVVYLIEDVEGIGWVKMQNKAFKSLDFDYFLYSCDDYFPGRDYLKIAMHTMKYMNSDAVIFNDGKWHGNIATAAVLKKELIKEYGDNLFYEGYQQNYADAELTDFFHYMGCVAYQPQAILMEVDYEKETKPHLNLEDKKLYNRRIVKWEKKFS